MIPKAITRLQNKIQKTLRTKELMKVLFQSKEFRDLVIGLNTQDQLYDQGIDSKGRSLGEYSPATIEGTNNFRGKKSKGQRYDHITLNDTGKFYKSFRIVFEDGALRIVADGQKDDKNLFQEFGIDIVGLTEFSLSVAINAAIPILQDHIRKEISGKS